jgi:hypothetical protein
MAERGLVDVEISGYEDDQLRDVVGVGVVVFHPFNIVGEGGGS